MGSSNAPAVSPDLLVPARVPRHLGDLRSSADQYEASEALDECIHTALVVGAPLLIAGKPGTGKTHAAYYAARKLGLLSDDPDSFLKVDITSETSIRDLFYRFDSVAYFHDAQVHARSAQPGAQGDARSPDKRQYVEKRALWTAFARSSAGQDTVVLLDEIDKAPRDFPNDLLNALDLHRFRVSEIDAEQHADPERPPLIIITSNSEKRLPAPFLRRCIYHYIKFDPQQVERVVSARCDGFPNLDAETHAEALRRFHELCKQPLLKPPATGELLVWLTVLSAWGSVTAADLKRASLGTLPGLHCLIKDHEDLERLQ